MTAPDTSAGRLLWQLLPEIYRNRDGDPTGGDGDLAAYLDAYGALLDAVRATLEQRLADCFPDDPDVRGERAGQAWLLPYFGRLVDAEPISPHPEGRRREVAEAITLRQLKGTVRGVERLAEVVSGKHEPGVGEGRAGAEVEVVEGWRTVAVTPRVSTPLLPYAAYGLPDPVADGEPVPPALAASHPGLPAATVDTRRFSRAVQVPAGTPGAHVSTFGTDELVSWRVEGGMGVPCFPGSYEDRSRRTVDARDPDQRRGHVHPRHVALFLAPSTGAALPGTVTAGELVADAGGLQGFEGEMIERLVVSAGSVSLTACVIGELVVESTDGDDPLLRATGCVFGEVSCAGAAELEYCTVLGDAAFDRLRASDCIFAGSLDLAAPEAPDGCLRYSRVPPGLPATAQHACTTERPVFLALPGCGDPDEAGPGFAAPGFGVLDVASPVAIRAGAEDGGEMGAFHRLAFTLEREAIETKVTRHLPLGVRPVVVVDPRLLRVPPVTGGD